LQQSIAVVFPFATDLQKPYHTIFDVWCGDLVGP
jgi:hypothetical protein